MKINLVGNVICGFPSPGEENREDSLDLNTLLIKHKCTTFYLRAYGDSMSPTIKENDILVVDRSLAPKVGDIIVATVDGDFTAKYLKKHDNSYYLVPENKNYKEIPITDSTTCFGVITSIVRQLRD